MYSLLKQEKKVSRAPEWLARSSNTPSWVAVKVLYILSTDALHGKQALDLMIKFRASEPLINPGELITPLTDTSTSYLHAAPPI